MDITATTAELPREFGGYELLAELGRGGEGVIFKARQPGLDRLCALKMLLDGRFQDPAAHSQLLAEARAAARLDHPNIVGIYEVGEVGGQSFFSMEFVEGETLTTFTRQRVLPARQVARYAQKIAAAIHYAHTQSILHCDLKPGNVIIDHRDEPQVTDFGLARRIGRLDAVGPGTGADGAGSPNFMAPEQASARFGELSVATDVFGLGATLYYLLTDRPPFRGETARDTIRAVLELDPIRPRLLRPGVPLDLETICLKCLEKRPSKRYASVQEVADELARFLRDEPIHARAISRWEREWRRARRHPWLTTFATATALLVTFVAIGSSVAAYRINAARREAEAQRQKAELAEQTTRRNLYAADMALAFQALESGNESSVRDILGRYEPAAGGPDFRGWEWRLLWGQSHSDQLFELGRHAANVFQAEALPDGHSVLTSDMAMMLTRYDLADRRIVNATNVRTSGSPFFALNRAGTRVAIADREGTDTDTTLRLIDTDSFQRVAAQRVPGVMIPACFGPDQTTVWLWNQTNVVELDLARGVVTSRQAQGGETSTTAFALAPSGDRFLLGDERGRVTLVDSAAPTNRWTIEAHQSSLIYGGVHMVEFSPDGDSFATAGGDGAVRLWNASTGERLTEFKGHTDLVFRARFSPDGHRLVTAGRDQYVKIWDVASGRLLSTLHGARAIQIAAAWLPGGNATGGEPELVTSGADRVLHVWTGAERARFVARTNFPPDVALLKLDHGGRHYYVVRDPHTQSEDYEVRSLASDRTIQSPRMPTNTIDAALWLAPDLTNGIAAAYLSGGTICLTTLNAGSTRQLQETNWLLVSSHTEVALDFSPDGSLLALGDSANGLRVWRTTDFSEVLRDRERGVRVVTFAPDGKRVLTGNLRGQLRLHELDSNRVVTATVETPSIQDVAFSPDGALFATAGIDGSARLYRADTGALVTRFVSRAGILFSVGFSPDGRQLAAGSGEGQFLLWDVGTRRELVAWKCQAQPVLSFGFQPDGALVTTGLNELRFWKVPSLEETRPL